jgi:hypothetical protein
MGTGLRRCGKALGVISQNCSTLVSNLEDRMMQANPDWKTLYSLLSGRIAKDDLARMNSHLRLERIALLRQLRNRLDAEADGTRPLFPIPEEELFAGLGAVL